MKSSLKLTLSPDLDEGEEGAATKLTVWLQPPSVSIVGDVLSTTGQRRGHGDTSPVQTSRPQCRNYELERTHLPFYLLKAIPPQTNIEK